MSGESAAGKASADECASEVSHQHEEQPPSERTFLYKLVLRFDGTEEHAITRALRDFEELKEDLEEANLASGSCVAPLDMKNQERVHEWLDACLKSLDVVRSNGLSEFLASSSRQQQQQQQSTPTLTPIDYLLQAQETISLEIPARSCSVIDMFLEKGESCVWSFEICHNDVAFEVLYRQQNKAAGSAERIAMDISVKLLDQYQAQATEEAKKKEQFSSVKVALNASRVSGTQQGSLTASARGVCRLSFNNEYSVLTAKRVEAKAQVVQREAINAALEASEEANRYMTMPRSALYERLLKCQTVELVSVCGSYCSSLAAAASDDRSANGGLALCHLPFVPEDHWLQKALSGVVVNVLPNAWISALALRRGQSSLTSSSMNSKQRVLASSGSGSDITDALLKRIDELEDANALLLAQRDTARIVALRYQNRLEEDKDNDIVEKTKDCASVGAGAAVIAADDGEDEVTEELAQIEVLRNVLCEQQKERVQEAHQLLNKKEEAVDGTEDKWQEERSLLLSRIADLEKDRSRATSRERSLSVSLELGEAKRLVANHERAMMQMEIDLEETKAAHRESLAQNTLLRRQLGSLLEQAHKEIQEANGKRTTHTHTYIHTNAYTHTHAYTRAHTHAHTH